MTGKLRSKLNSSLVCFNYAAIILFFVVWTYLTFKNGNGSWTPISESFSSIPWSGQEYEKIESFGTLSSETVSLGGYSEPARGFKSPDKTHTVPNVLREDDRMACNIKKLNPFDASIKEHLSNPEPANCEKDHPLIFKSDLNSTIIHVKNPEDYGYFDCCYKEIKRGSSDAEVTVEDMCIKVENVTVVPKHFESIAIYCKKLHEMMNTTIPVDMFNFVHLKPEVEQRVQKWEDGKELEGQRVNVVILGIDAVSHMNFHRTMPKTLKYITEKLKAIGMNGYTKPGDSTFPNVVAATTGMTVDELQKACWNQSQDPFDSCPFIWKKYSANGYRTASSEDAASIAAFNLGKGGFLKPPTDYYNNAFNFHLEKLLGHYKKSFCKICYGPRLGFQVSLDFLKSMRIRMGSSRRYFQFVWVTSLFHDLLNQAKLGDEPLLETMKWFNQERQLENTVFILMSDHGIRWGGIRSTVQGMIEERMPLLYFIFPDWFREKYDFAVSNLIQNTKRLTTHFDLHETLLDLIRLDNIKDKKLTRRYESLQAAELPRGISLFLPVPARRTCQDAGIEEHWCVCHSSLKLKDPNELPMIRTAAAEVVHMTNKMLAKFPQCASLKLDTVLSAQVLYTTGNKEMNDSSAQITSLDEKRLKREKFTCRVSFSVSPSNATFEATITRHRDYTWKVSDDVSRTNFYGSQSRCVSEYSVKKFCYCPM